MHIGLITGEYPPLQGGVGAYSQLLAKTLTQQGHDVSVFSSESTHSPDARIALTQAPSGWGYRTMRAIRQWVNTTQPDIVTLQYQTAAYDMSPWIHFMRRFLPDDVPLVTTFHDLLFPYLFPKAGPLRDWIVMHLARSSDGVIATNHEDHARLTHLPCHRLIPIGSNIPTQLPGSYDRQVWRQTAGADENTLLLAYFGFVNHSKGLDSLFEAIAQVRASVPVRLVMIGGRTGTADPTNAAYADQLDHLIDSLALEALIHRTGFVAAEMVSAWLDAADLVVLPFRDGASYRRGSLMAAIQHGCAIVSTMPPVTIPDFRHGETLWLVPPDDPESLAGALLTLHGDSALRDRLHTGAASLRGLFDWEHIAREQVAFFQQVIHHRQQQKQDRTSHVSA